MKRALLLALVGVTAAATAAGADAKKKAKKPPTLSERLLDMTDRALTRRAPMPRFAFALSEPWIDPKVDDLEGTNDFEMGFWVHKSTVALAADGTAAWVAADLAWSEPCGDETCPRVPKPDGFYHATILIDGLDGPAGGGDASAWKPLAWHVGYTTTARDQADAVNRGAAPTGLERRVLPGAEEAVKLFESTLGDPKALAKTVSKRADVVLLGTENKERYVGGAKVAATLTKWNLGLKLRDGIQAGATRSGSVAWVAANVDARSMKKPTAPTTPYRVMVVYEKTAAGWQVVQIHFSFIQ